MKNAPKYVHNLDETGQKLYKFLTRNDFEFSDISQALGKMNKNKINTVIKECGIFDDDINPYRFKRQFTGHDVLLICVMTYISERKVLSLRHVACLYTDMTGIESKNLSESDINKFIWEYPIVTPWYCDTHFLTMFVTGVDDVSWCVSDGRPIDFIVNKYWNFIIPLTVILKEISDRIGENLLPKLD